MHFQDRVSSDDANVDGHISAVAPKIAGNVVEVLVQDNQAVKAGDVLVRIDPRDFQAKVALAKAALMQAESQARSAGQVVPWTNDTTQSAISAAEAQLADATAEQERARLAYEQASSSELAFAEANVRAKEAANERAQADLARMKPLAREGGDLASCSTIPTSRRPVSPRASCGHRRNGSRPRRKTPPSARARWTRPPRA